MNRIRYDSNRLRWRTLESLKIVEFAFFMASTNPLRLHRGDLVSWLTNNKLINNLGTKIEDKDNGDDKEMSPSAIIDVDPSATCTFE